MVSTEEIRQIYAKEAPSYDKRIHLMERLTGIHHLRAELLSHATGDVLAVAVGTGRDFPFYRKDVRITGIDISPQMLSVASSVAKQEGLFIQILEMDTEHLTFANETFDTVVCTLALCTFSDPIAALREMKRVCKKNGKILLLEHGRSSSQFVRSIQRILSQHWIRKSGCHLLRDPGNLCREAGIVITSRKKTFFGILTSIEAKPL